MRLRPTLIESIGFWSWLRWEELVVWSSTGNPNGKPNSQILG
jgi:hypothetical protein